MHERSCRPPDLLSCLGGTNLDMRIQIFALLATVIPCRGIVARTGAHASAPNLKVAVSDNLLDTKTQIEHVDSLRKAVGNLVPRLEAGGRKARHTDA